MRHATILLWLLATLLGQLPALGQAQIRLTGQVRDALSQRPLPYASVFLANTTYGTTTDSTGHFVLTGVPGGQYEFMASYLGYELYRQTLDLQQSTTLAALLQPGAAQLTEVVVRPAKNRPADYQKFLKQFLGYSALSQQCRIENPQDIVVIYDETRRELTAVAPRNVQVLNQALGYRIIYHNFNFKVNYNANRCIFVAAPVFEELKSVDVRQQQRWNENRQRAYAGSLPHFLRCVREDHLAEEGFLVRAAVSEPNSEAAQRRVALANDSLAEVHTPESGLLTRVYKRPLPTTGFCRVEANASRYKLAFQHALQVTYQREPPDAMYAANMAIIRRNDLIRAEKSRWQASKSDISLGEQSFNPILEVSELQLLGPEALILPTGYLSNPLSLRVDGYWAFEKIGEALPLDYTPAVLKQ